MASIGDLFFALHGDDSQLQLDATKAGQSAGAKAGDSFSGAFGNIVKTAAGAVIGAGIGLALKAITQGAVELDAATRKYAADTGATVAETKLAGEQINALFRTNVDGYAVIGDVLAKLRTDLHVTGVEAQALAQDFLHYALATGQEPVAATDALTTAIKAWKVPADQIPALMDKIVAGHQLYGGSVSGNVEVLAKLAPALTAANIDIGTATGLLNLFSVSGLDSSKAAMAFQKALKTVHSPEELQALIAKIQATPDAFDRAKLAIALFGTRAGAQLAEALAPGSKSLADYTVTAQQSAGATDKAAEAIDQGFGNQVVLAFHNVEGALSGLATNIGPVVTVLDALGMMGIRVLPMLGGALGALVPKIIATIAPLLTVQATTLGLTDAEYALAVANGAVGASWLAVLGPLALVIAAFLLIETKGYEVAQGIREVQRANLEMLRNATDDPLLKQKLQEQMDIVTAAEQKALAEHDAAGAASAKLTAAADKAAIDAANGTTSTLTDIAVTGGKAIGDGMSKPVVAALDDIMSALSLEVTGFKKQWSELDSIATTAANDIYGKMIRADNLASNTRAINAENDIINSKKSTAQQVADAKARIVALQEEGLKIRIEMAGRGELSDKAYRQLIDALTIQANSNNREVRVSAQLALDELAKLKAAIVTMPAVNFKGSRQVGHNAAGGYLGAGDVSVVGEQGPELRVFAQDSYILTHQEALSIAAGKFGGSQAGGQGGGPLIGQQNIYGIQPDDVERQTRRALRRHDLEMSLAGHG